MNTLPLNSKYLMADSMSLSLIKQTEITNQIPEIHDLPINVVNNILYYQKDVIELYKNGKIIN